MVEYHTATIPYRANLLYEIYYNHSSDQSILAMITQSINTNQAILEQVRCHPSKCW